MSRHEIGDLQSVLDAMADGKYYQEPNPKKKGWTGARDGSGNEPTIPHGVKGIKMNRACIEPLPNIKSK